MNKHFADKLLAGETIECCPRGNSMKPKIDSGQLITISPDISDLHKGDVVFCKVRGKYFVHLKKTKSITSPCSPDINTVRPSLT